MPGAEAAAEMKDASTELNTAIKLLTDAKPYIPFITAENVYEAIRIFLERVGPKRKVQGEEPTEPFTYKSGPADVTARWRDSDVKG